MSHHRFEATVQQGGYGSLLTIDGIKVPEVRSFTVDVQIESARLTVETISPGNVTGLVDAITWLGQLHVVSVGGVPKRVFSDYDAALAFATSKGVTGYDICTIPCEVTR